jgi:phosphohistidine swiveling domain-containing protein
VSVTLTGRAAAPGWPGAPFPLAPADVVRPRPRDALRHGSTTRWRGSIRARHGREQLTALAERVTERSARRRPRSSRPTPSSPTIRSCARRRSTRSRRASAERGAITAFDTFRELLAASSSEYLAARATDLDDVRDRVVALLQGRDVSVSIPTERSVVVAHELTPSQTASLPRELIAALVTETGSPTSHAAILARSLGIPASSPCEGCSTRSARVARSPSTAGPARWSSTPTRTAARRSPPGSSGRSPPRRARRPPRRAGSDRRRPPGGAGRQPRQPRRPGRRGRGGRRGLRAGAHRVPVPGTAHRADVDDQVAFYTEVLRGLPGPPGRVPHHGRRRGQAAAVRGPRPEENPALGLRGIRLHLARPELFRDQLRALLRAHLAVADRGRGPARDHVPAGRHRPS